ncbi:MAG: hypothetical protein M3O70_13920 [Actinomycetota bacterium]|nr:hypothetical protein [Actinomycetota bacterium]
MQTGSAYWLRVPVGKLRNDRYIPLHPQLKEQLDHWLAARPQEVRSQPIFTDWGRPIPHARVDRALVKVAAAAGIEHVTAHQLGHALQPWRSTVACRSKPYLRIATGQLISVVAVHSAHDLLGGLVRYGQVVVLCVVREAVTPDEGTPRDRCHPGQRRSRSSPDRSHLYASQK